MAARVPFWNDFIKTKRTMKQNTMSGLHDMPVSKGGVNMMPVRLAIFMVHEPFL